MKDILKNAVSSGNIDEVKKLLANPKTNVNATDQRGITPLHEAVGEQYLQITKLLIERKANINAAGKAVSCSGMTPLHIAIATGNKEITKFLLENGADTESCIDTDASIVCLDIIEGRPKKQPQTFTERTEKSQVKSTGIIK